LAKLQIELIEAFKTPAPICLDDSNSADPPRVDEQPVTEPQPEVTEEQTVSIPGEEDLPIRTPTPELFGVYAFPDEVNHVRKQARFFL